MTPLQRDLAAALEKHSRGDLTTATALYRDILTAEPGQADALHMLGVIAQQTGNSELALKLMEAAIAKNPEFAQAWFNRCIVLRKLDRKDEALLSARQAVAINPQMAEAWDMAGSILREQRHFAEACLCLERAVALQPNNASILNSYIVLLTAAGRLQDAWQVVHKMKDLGVDDVSSLTGIGNLLKSAGHPQKAVPWFRKARDLMPDYPGALLNEAMALLQTGDMTNGLALWERRLEDKARPPLPAVAWDGSYVEHLLLREDQGMGDALQCLRYIPLVQQRVGRITLQLTGFLKNVLTPNLPGVTLITLDDKTPDADASLQLMSLPALFSHDLETIPQNIPYIRSDPSWREPWKARLAHLPRPLIGLVWGGNPLNRHDYNRALNFSQLAPVIAAGPQHFISLQKGPQKNAAELLAAGVFDADPFLTDFTATSGLMDELDLVITICSSPAHLAGAMGRPTFLMLCFDPHWVWLLGRDDTPWYPHTRLFRQKKPGDWSHVTDSVAAQVRKLIGGDRSVLDPPVPTGLSASENPDAIDLEARDTSP